MADFMTELTRSRLVAIIRGTDPGAAATAAAVLFEGGINCVEIALTTPGALQAIEKIRSQLPEGAWVGAGTVLTTVDAEHAAGSGAQFVVTPGVTESIAAAAGLGLPVLAGAFTPTEALDAMTRGASAVKLFPASAAGPGYLSALRGPLPRIPFIAVGGIGLAEAPGFFRAGAMALGLGSPLLGDAATPAGNLRALRTRARQYRQVVIDEAAAG